MSELFTWTKIILVIGGMLICLVGMVWYKGARLLNFFDVSINAERGFWVMVTGFALMSAGLGLVYLTSESR